MKFTAKLFVLTCALVLSNVSYASTDDAIAAAEEARKAAAAVGYEWRDTAKMIKKAKDLAAKGKSEEAMKLARKAEEQGKDALAQYRREQQRYTSNH